MWSKVKVIHYIGKTLLKRLEMPLNDFIHISLAIYVRMCVRFLSVYLCGCKGNYKQHKNDAQNRVICAILGIFCKESGKLWGKMKKK